MFYGLVTIFHGEDANGSISSFVKFFATQKEAEFFGKKYKFYYLLDEELYQCQCLGYVDIGGTDCGCEWCQDVCSPMRGYLENALNLEEVLEYLPKIEEKCFNYNVVIKYQVGEVKL